MNKKVVLIILCVITLLLVTASFFFLASSQQGSSIGIIGGADGPTTIFITGNPLGLYITTGLFLIAATVWYLIYRSGNSR